MFPTAGIEFLRQLKENNDRAWFDAHRSSYESDVRAPMLAIVAAVNDRLEAFASAYVNRSGTGLARIQRDVRFGADKTPYKTQMTAVFALAGRQRDESAGFYLRIGVDGAQVQGGILRPAPAALVRLREAIADGLPCVTEVIEIVGERMGPLQGEKLRRVPKGFRADHPAAELLKHRQLYFSAALPLDVVTSDRLVDAVAERFDALSFFVTWLDYELGERRRAA
jgi:uncharacterized protein (TIGR02453 family)